VAVQESKRFTTAGKGVDSPRSYRENALWPPPVSSAALAWLRRSFRRIRQVTPAPEPEVSHKEFRLYLLSTQSSAPHAARLLPSLMLDLKFARRGLPLQAARRPFETPNNENAKQTHFPFSISTKQTGRLVRNEATGRRVRNRRRAASQVLLAESGHGMAPAQLRSNPASDTIANRGGMLV
jgi:hypothetical protein